MAFSSEGAEAEPGTTLELHYAKLLRELGPQGWWPGRTRLEVILGAILTQNTSWRNAALALKNLRQSGRLGLASLRKASRTELETEIRPAGFFRQKARAISNFLDWLDSACAGSLRAMFARPGDLLRSELLQIKGLGPETVDAILLYAGGQPFFVADAYTRRILSRHGHVPPDAGYAAVQSFLHRSLPRDPAFFNEYHALLVEVGKRFCGRQVARCDTCPLEKFLPSDKPLERQGRGSGAQRSVGLRTLPRPVTPAPGLQGQH